MARCRENHCFVRRVKTGFIMLALLSGCSEATGSVNFTEPKADANVTKPVKRNGTAYMQEKPTDFILSLCSTLEKSNASIRKDLSHFPVRQKAADTSGPAEDIFRLDQDPRASFATLSIVFGDQAGTAGLMPNGLRATLLPKDGFSLSLSEIEAVLGKSRVLPSRPILVKMDQIGSPNGPKPQNMLYSFETPYPGDNQPLCRVTAAYASDATKADAALVSIVFDVDFRAG